jgi:Xaa-Pro aminopeptidase
MVALLSSAAPARLSARQREVLGLVAVGHPDKAIAHELGISERTIRAHLAECRTRLGARSRSHLVALAFNEGLLPPDSSGRTGPTARCDPAVLLFGDSYRSADLYHATRFASDEPVAFVEDRGERYLLTSPLALDRAREETAFDGAWSFADFDDGTVPPHDPDRRIAHSVASFLHAKDITEVLAAPTLPALVADEIRGIGMAVRFDAGISERRRTKAADEVTAIQETLSTLEDALVIARSALRRCQVSSGGELILEGAAMTPDRLRAIVNTALSERDCVAEGTLILAGGEESADPHRAGSRGYRVGEPIVLDLAARNRITRYCADIARTICRGPVPDVIRRMHAAILRAQDAAIASVRPGVRASEVHDTVKATLAEAGFDVERGPVRFGHPTGHGVGLELHEPPSLAKWTIDVLQPGDLITIEPGLYQDGVGGVRVEDMILVTGEGALNMTRAQRDLTL